MFRLTILFFALFVFATQAFDNNKTAGDTSSTQGKWQQQATLTSGRHP